MQFYDHTSCCCLKDTTTTSEVKVAKELVEAKILSEKEKLIEEKAKSALVQIEKEQAEAKLAAEKAALEEKKAKLTAEKAALDKQNAKLVKVEQEQAEAKLEKEKPKVMDTQGLAAKLKLAEQVAKEEQKLKSESGQKAILEQQLEAIFFENHRYSFQMTSILLSLLLLLFDCFSL